MELGHSRLWRELEEIEREPLEGIRIHIHDGTNLRRMCLILTPMVGPFLGYKFHLNVTIHESYPDSPPTVTMQSKIRHPNISYSHVRCDGFGGDYTPTYMLKYLFLQLLCLVSSETIAQRNGNAPINMDEYAAEDYSWTECTFFCEICGFYAQDRAEVGKVGTNGAEGGQVGEKGGEVGEAGTEVGEVGAAGGDGKEWGDVASRSLFDALDSDSLRGLVGRVNDQSVVHLSQAYQSMKEFVETNNVLLERSLFCSYTRQSMEEGAVLGLEIDSETKIVMSADLISYEAYFSRNRGSFLPLALSASHFKRSKEVLQNQLQFLSGRSDWSPETVLESIPVVLDSMTKAFMSQAIPFCQKSLEVLFLLFHLFWKLAEEDQALRQAITSKMNLFVKHVSSRTIDSTPNLGAFFMYALVDRDVKANRLGGIVLQEFLTRKVVEILQRCPCLAYQEPRDYDSELRLKKSFEVCLDSLKTLAFQTNFIHMVKDVDPAELGRRYGFPSEDVSSKLLKVAKATVVMESWNDFVEQLKIPVTMQGILSLLRSTIKASEKNGYHENPFKQNELYLLRKAEEPSCPEPKRFKQPRKRTRVVEYNFVPKKQHI